MAAGQILGHTSLETPGLFQWSFGITSVSALLVLIAYHTFGKKYERKLIAEKTELLEKTKKEAEAKEVEKAPKDTEKEKGGKDNLGVELNEDLKSLNTSEYNRSWASGSVISTRF